jgi:hypothetical protein
MFGDNRPIEERLPKPTTWLSVEPSTSLAGREYVWITLLDSRVQSAMKVTADTLREAREQVIEELLDHEINLTKEEAKIKIMKLEGETWMVIKLQ